MTLKKEIDEKYRAEEFDSNMKLVGFLVCLGSAVFMISVLFWVGSKLMGHS